MTDLGFYQTIPICKNLTEIDPNIHLRSVPHDWVVILSDIAGSTKAVEAGAYRDVNLAGVTLISVLQNHFKTRDFPFVFGGDGATAIVPPDRFETLKKDLQSLIQRIKNTFQLELKIGFVKMSELAQNQKTISMGRLRLSEKNQIAILCGDGIAHSESLIKKNPNYQLSSLTDSSIDLSRVSCRFSPIQSRRGHILTLLISTQDSSQLLPPEPVLKFLKNYLSLESHKPLSPEQLQMDSFWRVFRKQCLIEPNRSKAIVFLQILFLTLLFRSLSFIRNTKMGKVINNYFYEIPQNSDYQKYDGTLRAILDCNQKEVDEILAALEKFKTEGLIHYGHHLSKRAVMTCLVDSIQDHEHIHFIDGENCGYTQAARKLKLQL